MSTIVEVTGCISEGFECLVLKDDKGKPNYSINRSDVLEVGAAYRITGTVREISA